MRKASVDDGDLGLGIADMRSFAALTGYDGDSLTWSEDLDAFIDLVDDNSGSEELDAFTDLVDDKS
eukprot:3485254-Karenia_brevis.AAC.1